MSSKFRQSVTHSYKSPSFRIRRSKQKYLKLSQEQVLTWNKTMYKFAWLFQSVLVHGLSCDDVLQLPADTKLSLSELKLMPPDDMVQCLRHLSRDRMLNTEATFIWKSLIKFYGGIINIPDEILMSLHWVTVAVSPDDYNNITLNSIDVIENFGLNYNLDDRQLTAIANKIRTDFSGKEPEDYTYYDLTALRQILCAFNESEISRIHPAAYREAALIIAELDSCNENVMKEFGLLAVQDRAFGPIENWNENTIKIVGKVVDFLPEVFAKQLPRRFQSIKLNGI